MGKKIRRARVAQKRFLRMTNRVLQRRGKKPGASPGTMVHTGEKRTDQPRLSLIRYDAQDFESTDIGTADLASVFAPGKPGQVTWLNIDGLHDTALLQEVGQCAGLHDLVLEDLVSVGQRPKQEEYDGHHFVVLRMLRYDETKHEVGEEQLSLILGPDYVLSFQESEGDSFDPVRERLRHSRGKIRARGADYLAYALMDVVVDEYFVALERIGDRLVELEQRVLEKPNSDNVAEIYHVKNELLVMRKAVWPLRDLFNTLLRDESKQFLPGTRLYLRDAYDHAVQVIDGVETMRDLTSGLLDLYMSSVSNRMNETMKVLTVIATLFIPLTFIVGVYGMNFDVMPELRWRWAYPVLWLFMVCVWAGMYEYFRRKSWL